MLLKTVCIVCKVIDCYELNKNFIIHDFSLIVGDFVY